MLLFGILVVLISVFTTLALLILLGWFQEAPAQKTSKPASQELKSLAPVPPPKLKRARIYLLTPGDPELYREGILAAGNYLKFREGGFTEIFCSTHQKCVDTAEIIKPVLGFKWTLRKSPYLRRTPPLGAGESESKGLAGWEKKRLELMGKDPILFFENYTQNMINLTKEFHAEAPWSVGNRLGDFLRLLPEEGAVLVIAHTETVAALLRLMLHLETGELKAPEGYCQLSLVKKMGERYTLLAPPQVDYLSHWLPQN